MRKNHRKICQPGKVTPSLVPLCLLTLGLMTLALCLPGCSPVTLTVGGPPAGRLQPTLVSSDGKWFSDRIDIIDISGMIFNANQTGFLGSNENPIALLDERLRAASADPKTKAVIIRINSPGGTVTASDSMYRLINDFKASTGKPVVACVLDMAASGGYYVACASDEIVAYPSSITGSVGVLIQTVSFKPALTRWGISTDAITSGKNKAAGNPLENLSKEQRDVFQSLVDEFHAQFVAIVKANRTRLHQDKLDEVFDGRVYSGTQALNIGLVDHLGGLDLAITRAKALADIQHADVYIYARPQRYVGSAYAQAPTSPTGGTQFNLAQINLDHGLTSDGGAGFYYLWSPSLP